MEPLLYLGIGMVVGLALGGFMGWLMGRQGAAAAPADTSLLQELRAQLSQREGELKETQQKIELLNRQLADAQAEARSARELLQNERETHQRALQEWRAQQEKALQDLSDRFKALSLEALKTTQPEFLRLAEQTLKTFQESARGDLVQRQEAIAGLLKPLQETLNQYQQRLQQSESSQSAMLGEVKKQLESLSQQSKSLADETLQFRMVLKNAQARGRWGEETLRRVVEAAGMSAHCEFEIQMGVEGQRPDLVVRLPGERVIIVDSKVPDLDFLAALDEADPRRRQKLLERHADKLKETIKDLARRNYPELFPNALDYVVLFLPAESLFSAALEGDRDLLVWAAGQKILLATPASLIALLRSVSVSWQYYQQSQNAREIAKEAGELYKRVATFLKYFGDIGAGLDKALDAYNKAVRSYESRLRIQGERLRELGGAQGNDSLPEINQIEHTVHPPPSP